MPISAMRAAQCGRPPSTMPAPCSTLEPIIAPNIQLAGNFSSRSNSAAATAAATSPASSSGDGDRMAARRRRSRWRITPVSGSSSGSAAVRMITRMVCTTAMPGRRRRARSPAW